MRIRWVAAAGVLALVAACSSGNGDGDATVVLIRLPVGDDSVSATETEVGVLCTTMPGGGGGAPTQGPWFNGDGTFDDDAKYVVEGEIEWPHELDTVGCFRGTTMARAPAAPVGPPPGQ